MNAQRSLFHDTVPTIDEVMSAWDLAHQDWISRKELAARLGRAKSPTLIALVNVAASLGYLEVRNDVLPNGADYYKYRPSKGWLDAQGGIQY